MALDKTSLKNAIKTATLAAVGSATADEDFAVALSNAIDTFVRSGTVSTTVTGTLPTGPVAAGGSGGVT